MDEELFASLSDLPLSGTLTGTEMDCETTNNQPVSAQINGTLENRISTLCKNVGASVHELFSAVINEVDIDSAFQVKQTRKNTDVVSPEDLKRLTKQQKINVRSKRNQKVGRQKLTIVKNLHSRALKCVTHELQNKHFENLRVTHDNKLLADENRKKDIEISRLTHDNKLFADENRILRSKYQALAAKYRELMRRLKDSSGPGPESGPDNPPSGGSSMDDDGQDDDEDEDDDSDSGGSGRSSPSSTGGTAIRSGSSSNSKSPSESMLVAQLPNGTPDGYLASSLNKGSFSEHFGIGEESFVELDSNSDDNDDLVRKIDELSLTEDIMSEPREMNEEGCQKSVSNNAISSTLESSADHGTGTSQEMCKSEKPNQCLTPESQTPATKVSFEASEKRNLPSGGSSKNDAVHHEDDDDESGSGEPDHSFSSPTGELAFYANSSEESHSDEENVATLDSGTIRRQKVDESLVPKARMPGTRRMNEEEDGQKFISRGTNPSNLESCAEHDTGTSPQLNYLKEKETGRSTKGNPPLTPEPRIIPLYKSPMPSKRRIILDYDYDSDISSIELPPPLELPPTLELLPRVKLPQSKSEASKPTVPEAPVSL